MSPRQTKAGLQSKFHCLKGAKAELSVLHFSALRHRSWVRIICLLFKFLKKILLQSGGGGS